MFKVGDVVYANNPTNNPVFSYDSSSRWFYSNKNIKLIITKFNDSYQQYYVDYLDDKDEPKFYSIKGWGFPAEVLTLAVKPNTKPEWL